MAVGVLVGTEGVFVRVGVLVGTEGVFVRVGVFVGTEGVFVRVGVLVGTEGVFVRVGVLVGAAGVSVGPLPPPGSNPSASAPGSPVVSCAVGTQSAGVTTPSDSWAPR